MAECIVAEEEKKSRTSLECFEVELDAFDKLPETHAEGDLVIHRQKALGFSEETVGSPSPLPSTNTDTNIAVDVAEDGLTTEELAQRLAAGTLDLRLSVDVTKHMSFIPQKRPSGVESTEENATLTIFGRIGHGHLMNGCYFVAAEKHHDGYPVLLHRDPIPDGYEEMSGKHLHLFYSKTNDAWALSTECGSLEVLAYMHGNVFNVNGPRPSLEPKWIVSNEAGEYVVDRDITMSGPLARQIRTDDGDDHDNDNDNDNHNDNDDHEEDCDSSVSDLHSDTSDTQSVSEDEKSLNSNTDNNNGNGNSSNNTNNNNTDIIINIHPSDSDQQSLTPKRHKKFGRNIFRKSLKKEKKEKGVGGRKDKRSFRRHERHSRTAVKALDTFNTKTSALSRKSLVTQMGLLAQSEVTIRDSATAMCDAMLSIWETLLGCLDSTSTNDQAHYFTTIISVMLRDDFDSFGVAFTTDQARAVRTTNIINNTQDYVCRKMAPVDLTLGVDMVSFCAKVIAINYFRIPGLANDIVHAIVENTAHSGVRSRRLGDRVCTEMEQQHNNLREHVPFRQQIKFAAIQDICCVTSIYKEPPPRWHIPGTYVIVSPSITDTLKQWRHNKSTHTHTFAVPDDDASQPNIAQGWERLFFVPSGRASERGINFLSTFVEILFHRARDLYSLSYFGTKSDKQLGINEQHDIATIYMPGYTEIVSSFLRIICISEQALKPSYRIGSGPPSMICNWRDRVVQCALAISKDSLVFNCLMRDLMEQTSFTHVIDVMALLNSIKVFMESYCQMHNATFDDNIDIGLFVSFMSKLLLTCKHYVVVMFTMRWLYECADYFHPHHRTQILSVFLNQEILNLTFSHWEPAVRHMACTLVLYRLVPPDHIELQQQFFVRLEQVLTPHRHTQENTDTTSPTPASQSMGSNCDQFIAYLQQVKNACSNHPMSPTPTPTTSTPPTPTPPTTTPTTTTPTTPTPTPTPKTPTEITNANNTTPPRDTQLELARTHNLHSSRYASRSLDELSKALTSGVDWLKGHRLSSTEDELYPPLNLRLPPMQHMSSAYSEG